MSEQVDSVTALTQSVAVPGIFIEHRLIAKGDEGALFAEEALHLAHATSSVRRQSGAARIAARALLRKLNCNRAAITNAPNGAPVWPLGFVGSLAHDERVAVAAVARKIDFAGIGIDVEPAIDLPSDLIELVASPKERSRYGRSILSSRRLFVAKEAVYKAVSTLDQVFLDFHDIDVDLERQTAFVIYGRSVAVKVSMGQHVMALAFVES